MCELARSAERHSGHEAVAQYPIVVNPEMSQSQYIAHVTVAGERWDLLAWTYYGDASLYSPIIMANTLIPIEPAFEAGLHIAIPLLQVSQSATANLPPWKAAL